MKKTKGKKRIFLLALMILVVMAVTTGVWQQQRQIEKVSVEEVSIALVEDEQPPGLMPQKIETLPQQVKQEQKQKISYEQCVNQWTPMQATKNAVLQLDQGKVQVTFNQTVNYMQATQKVNEYDLEVDKIVNIFGMLMKKKMTDAESFNQMKTMILKSGKKSIAGKEIETACMLLQEQEVREASPVVKFNIAQE